jgi:flavin reductase (DIM6/NTAB) family NADH-FMN oxidoreductase RutF
VRTSGELVTNTEGADASRPELTIDPTLFRETLGHYPTGVVIVTFYDQAGSPDGMVIGSFTSVSLDPPLVAFLPSKSSRSYARMRSAERFCVNILSAAQEGLCRGFASGQGERFANVPCHVSRAGVPVLDDAVAWLDCRTKAVYDGGDHDIVICEVTDLGVQHQESPLLFFQGGYGRFAHRTLVAANAELISAVRAAERARNRLQALADQLAIEVTVLAAHGREMIYVASAVHPDVHPLALLGTRSPLLAPLGELHVARRSAAEIDAWVDHHMFDDATRQEQLVRMSQARDRGWAASMTGGRPEGELRSALRRYSSSELTPAEHREVTRVIARATPFYPPFEPVEGERYNLHSLVVAVPNGAEPVELVVRLSQLPQNVPTGTVLDWVESGRRVAAAIAENAQVLT